MNQYRSIRLRFWPWFVIAALLMIIAAYRWNHARMWTLTSRSNGPVCQVRPGWTEKDVFLHCGPRSGRGVQPKVPASGSGLSDLRMCSAAGDVYGAKVVLYDCDGRVQAVANMPAQGFIFPSRDEHVASPESATAVSSEVSPALVGKQITIRGTFSLRCKVPACIGLDNHQVIYLNGSWGGATYSEWEGKLVAVTGILRYYHAPPAEPTDRTVARSPDHFYFEETAQVRVLSGNPQTESKPRRTVKGLPKYMTDIPQPIPPQVKLPDAPKTAREAKCFASFSITSSITDVVRKCGIPDEAQGSGICILLYDMDDGSVVVIGTADLKKLMYINQITDRGSRSLL